MTPKDAKKPRRGSLARVIILALIGFGLLVKILLDGTNVAVINTKGLIAEEQFGIMVFVIGVLLVMIVPSLILAYFIAWKYREGNEKATHEPEARSGKSVVTATWLVPTVTMAVLSVFMWQVTHRLEPQAPISSDVKPLTIQVVSLQWKWLFIYPEQDIATVNFVQIPTDTPVTFELTADEAPMSAFWIPNLGGMLYSMTGMVNPLNLMATTPGDYPGSTAEINGAGFAGMKFTARASSRAEFDQWVEEVKWSPEVLDSVAYDTLVKPSESNPAAFYSDFEPGLYDKVLMKYTPDSHTDNTTEAHAH